jgi:replicative DNA helicase
MRPSCSPYPLMSSPLQLRVYLESQVLGAAIFTPKHALTILDILSEANFRDESHRKLFQILTTQSLKGELEFTSIALGWQGADGSASYLITLLDKYLGGPVDQLAVTLLEMDMRDKFAQLLKKAESEAVRVQEFEQASMYKQCHTFLIDPRNDLFDAVPKLYEYLAQYVPEEMEDYKKLMDAIPKLIDRLRKRARTRQYLAAIASMPNAAVTHEQKISLEMLGELMTSCLSRATIPAHFISSLNDLKNNLWTAPAPTPAIPSARSTPF